MDVLSPSLKKLWNEWQLQILVLLSLTLQIILIILGNRRKYIYKTWIKIIIWPTYLSADFIATAALGVLMNRFVCHVGDINAKLELTAFWAPFLLLHLGGPDTITAYSLEDNELWERHLLQLVVQTGFAFYILIVAWTGSYISILSIPMMVAGLIKYGERTWALWSASFEKRSESMSSFRDMIEALSDVQDFSNIPEDKLLQVAYGMFEIVKRLFAGVPITAIELAELADLEETVNFLEKISPKDAFRVIEMQLGFMYDMLYTKAMVTYTRWGIGLRFISFLLTSIVLVVFSLASLNTQRYSKVDLCITFSLLGMAITLELYAAVLMLLSDHALVWLGKHSRGNISRVIISAPLLRNPRWSNSMGQYHLLSYFLKEKPMDLISKIHKKLEKHQYVAYHQVPNDLKEWSVMYSKKYKDHLKGDPSRVIHSKVVRGGMTLDSKGYIHDPILMNSTALEFQQTILVWHIATELCYHLHDDCFAQKKEEIKCRRAKIEEATNENTLMLDNIILNRKMSKHISRYMMYLLAISPETLPGSGAIGQINFRFTCDEARKELEKIFKPEPDQVRTKKEREKKNKIQAAKLLFDRHRHSITDEDEIITQLNGSLLSVGCKVADCLLEGASADDLKKQDRIWEAISGVWVEFLISAGTQSEGNRHAQPLKQGGEFLNHFWILYSELRPLNERAILRITESDMSTRETLELDTSVELSN